MVNYKISSSVYSKILTGKINFAETAPVQSWSNRNQEINKIYFYRNNVALTPTGSESLWSLRHKPVPITRKIVLTTLFRSGRQEKRYFTPFSCGWPEFFLLSSPFRDLSDIYVERFTDSLINRLERFEGSEIPCLFGLRKKLEIREI